MKIEIECLKGFHLGNVLATVSDRKLVNETAPSSGIVDYYDADVSSYSEYYPYGAVLPGRSGSDGNNYRYGFQGQEDDPELKGAGNSVNYKYRMHDPRIGRFFAVDPLAARYAHNSPYAFSENRVIDGIELEGLEYVNANKIINNETGETFAEVFGDLYEAGSDKIVEYNGEIYYKVTIDIYRIDDPANDDGSLSFIEGDGKTRITEWIYPNSNLADEKDHVVYEGNCFSAACKEASNLGTDISADGAYFTTIQMSNSGNGPRLATAATMRYGINMINHSLEMGVPIVVGIDYGEGDGDGNYDGTTDHFVVITGRGSDENGDYFLYHDNATSNTQFFKLYIDESGSVTSSDPNSFIGEGAKVSNVVMNEQLRAIFNNIHLTQ